MCRKFRISCIVSIAVFIIIHFSLLIASAQIVQQEWVRRFTDTATVNWSASSIKFDSLGFIYVLAERGNDFGFIKYSPNGNLLVVATYWPGGYSSGGGSYFDVTPNGDVYITGGVNENFNSWIYTVKFNSSGVFQWGRFYNPDNSDAVSDIKVDRTGSVIIVGGALVGNTNYALTIKYDTNGDTLWTRYFNQPPNYPDFNNKIVLDASNNIYITGYMVVPGIPGKCLILNYRPSGYLNWYTTVTIDSTYTNSGYGISLDNNGNIYVLCISNTSGLFRDYLVKLTNGGIILWNKIFNGIIGGLGGRVSGIPQGPVISLDGSSIYYTTEAANGLGGSARSIATIKYNSSGDSQWVSVFNGGGIYGTANSPASIKLDRYDNIYICGVAYYQNTGDDFATIKYLPSGVQKWVETYSGVITNGGDYAKDLFIDTSFNVYVTGYSRNMANNGYVAATIKYSQIVGIISNNNQLPNRYNLYQNYPNPFNPTTKIRFSIPLIKGGLRGLSDGVVLLKIYDILGREITTIVNQQLKPGSYEVEWDGSKYASGIYIYRLETENFTDTKKMILLK